MTSNPIAFFSSLALTILLYIILRICAQNNVEKLETVMRTLTHISIIFTIILAIPQLSALIETIIEPPSTEPTEIESSVASSETIVSGTIHTPLTHCFFVDDSNQSGSNTDVCVGDWTDVDGNYYPNSLRFWVIDDPKWSNTEHVTYRLEEQYETISGTIAAEQKCDHGASFVFTIYLDGNPVYETAKITDSSGPLDFSYIICGASEITIVCTTDSASSGYCIFSATLS